MITAQEIRYNNTTYVFLSVLQASPYPVLNSLVVVLLMMGIMMPETCWE
jgi:hypothetical protein